MRRSLVLPKSAIAAVARARLKQDLPLLVGVLTFAFVWAGQAPPGTGCDFDYFWVAGQAVWHGKDPYVAVGEAASRGALRWPFYYPATAALFMAPFGALPRRFAFALFAGVGMALLAISVRQGPSWRRWVVLSAPAVQAVLFGQWSPWLTAAIGIPALRPIWAVKPSIGSALTIGWPSKWLLGGGLMVLTLSFLVVPGWLSEWLAAIRGTPQYLAPVQRAGGVLLLLAFLRWRRPEARMLGAMALVPHTAGLYESLPLLLIPTSGFGFALLVILQYVFALISYGLLPHNPTYVPATLNSEWPFLLALIYIPALVLVLRQPPEGRQILPTA